MCAGGHARRKRKGDQIVVIFLPSPSVSTLAAALRAARQSPDDDWNDWRTTSRPIFAAVETLAAECMRYKRLVFKCKTACWTWTRIKRCCDFDRAAATAAEGDFGDQPVIVSILPVVATWVSAAINCAGNTLRRFSARRRIPAQAFALK